MSRFSNTISEVANESLAALLPSRRFLDRMPFRASNRPSDELNDTQRRAVRVLCELREYAVLRRLDLALVADDLSYRRAATEVVVGLMQSISPSELNAFDDWLRRAPYGERPRLDAASIRRLTSHIIAVSANVDALGLLACNGSGFVRLEAVRALRASVDSRGLRYLALRADDWVGVVAAEATAALIERCECDRVSELIVVLPILGRLRRSIRCRDSAALDRIDGFLMDRAWSAIVAELPNMQREGRRLALDLASRRCPVQGAENLAPFLRDPDPALRDRAFMESCRHSKLSEIEPAIRAALRDPYPRLRFHAIGRLAQVALPDRRALVECHLFDRSSRVRDRAIELDRELGLDLDPMGRYRRERGDPTSSRLAVALRSLGVHGDRSDAVAAQPFHSHPRSAVRAAAFATAEVTPELLTAAVRALSDPSTRVVLAAAGMISKRIGLVPVGDLIQVVRFDSRRSVVRRALRLADLRSKWLSLGMLLELVVDPAWSTEASQRLRMWSVRSNRRFTVATADDLAVLRTRFEQVAKSLPKHLEHDLRGWIANAD